LANASSLSTLNPIIVNLELGLYGLLFVSVFIYVHRKFRKAADLLQDMQKEWAKAEAAHSRLLEAVQKSLAGMTLESGAAPSFAVEFATVTPDLRNQVSAMGRRGIPAAEIARSCGLPEGEVDVLLGMSRLQRAEVSAL
jgi:hypothetical protein